VKKISGSKEPILSCEAPNKGYVGWHKDGGTKLMKTPAHLDTDASSDGSHGIRFWDYLSKAGMEYLNQLRAHISKEGPFPGALVFAESRAIRSDSGLDAALFSAIDVCTHLQIARPYFLSSKAAAFDFLEFLMHAFPFSIREIRTLGHPPFSANEASQSQHPFTLHTERLAVRHSVLHGEGEERALMFLSSYFYPKGILGVESSPSGQKVLSDLHRFVYFHNNHRSLATLDGKTPIRVLQSFAEFRGISSFDPFSLSGATR